jgi:hypothetical protein
VAGCGQQYNGLPIRIDSDAKHTVALPDDANVQQLVDRLAALPDEPIAVRTE